MKMMNYLMDLLAAVSDEDREAAYLNLETVGVDRKTADEMAAEFYR